MAADWTPAAISTALWLDAADSSTITESGGAVSVWADKSGNGRDASQTTSASQPAYGTQTVNGHNVVTFDGSDDCFDVDLDFLADKSHSAFFVTLARNYVVFYGAANGNQGSNSLHIGFDGGNYEVSYWGSGFEVSIGAAFVHDEVNALNFVWDNNTGRRVWANGHLEGSTSLTGIIGVMSGGGRIADVCGKPVYSGDIAEVVFYEGVLPDAVRQKTEGYLAHKWGLEANLPADHPYKAAAPLTVSISGTVTGADGNPAARTVRFYDRATGQLVDETISDATTGEYEQAFADTSEYQRIVLADETELYNDIIDRVIPG